MYERIISAMQEKGIIISQKRIWIVEAICRAGNVCDVEEFWLSLRKRHPISWATTYNTLRVLHDYGILEKEVSGSKSIAYYVNDEAKD
ncbi:transcriptional repressor [Sphingobacterium oryzagri]|uniref:Transcriptional repressor n=1 Tax=Sphingobacterium oryzagri TaxID=3025669 RepID=A0ABY7WPS0_9SPHI|nr:transcriptional repressor [Sphingobacterium sp. KACC 22765]WDF70722.1 transcriptional repressor [Sphingobacterium sp. KACC 22765]